MLLAVPVGLILAYSFFERGAFGGVEYDFTLANFERASESLYLGILWFSLRVALEATLIALLIGYPTAWFIANRSPKWRTFLLVLVVLPFWTSLLIRTYAWIVLLNREGLVTQLLRWLGHTGEPPSMLYTEGAVIAGLVLGKGNINQGLTLETFLWSLLGAVILLAVVNLVRRGSVR